MWSIRNERLTTKKRGEGFFFFSSSVARYVTIVKTSVGGRQHRICSPFHQQEKSFWNFFFTLLEREGQRRSIVTAKMCQLLHKVRKYESDRQGLTMWRESLMGINRVAIFNFFFSAACEGSFLGGKLSILLHFPTHSTTACDFERMEIS